MYCANMDEYEYTSPRARLEESFRVNVGDNLDPFPSSEGWTVCASAETTEYSETDDAESLCVTAAFGFSLTTSIGKVLDVEE